MMKWLTAFCLIGLFSNIMTNDYDVIILGAGMAGLGAMKQLKDYNVTNYVVLEGNDYIGGRVKNIEYEGASIPLGAGWISLADQMHVMARLMIKYNMTYFDDRVGITDYPVWNRKTGKLYTQFEVAFPALRYENSLSMIATKLIDRLRNGGSDMSLSSALRWTGWNPKTDLELLLEYNYIDLSAAAAPDVMGAGPYIQRSSGAEYIVTDPRGYIYPAMQEIKDVESKIKLNHTVTRIKKNSHQNYTIYTDNGMQWNAKHVIITFSTGVLNADIVTFEPALPSWKKESLSLLPMGYLCKVIAQFPTKFWNDTTYFYTTGTNRLDYMIWQDASKLYNVSNMVLLFVAGIGCKNMERYNDNEIMDQILDVLNDVYPSAVRPNKIFRNTFNHDQKFMGSYSYPTPSLDVNDYMALEHPIDQGIWFAGEYLGRTTSSYAHVAYQSGIDVVKVLLHCMTTGDCPENQPQRNQTCPNITTPIDPNNGRNDHDHSVIHHVSIIQILLVTFVAMLFIRQ